MILRPMLDLLPTFMDLKNKKMSGEDSGYLMCLNCWLLYFAVCVTCEVYKWSCMLVKNPEKHLSTYFARVRDSSI